FQLHGDGEPVLFYYEDCGIRAMNVVMKRDIEKDKFFSGKIPEGVFFDISTPYGYGGFLIEGEITENSLKKLYNEYSSFCKINSIISEFARLHPLLNNLSVLSSLYDISYLGNSISIELNSLNQIWHELTSQNRNKIRKAIISSVEIYWGRDPKLFAEFKVLYNATMDKVKATDYYYFQDSFYNSILTDLKNNALMFYAVYEGKIIAMSIILFSNQHMHYHLSASDINYQHLAPTNLLLYEAACWGCENGYKAFHLGGGLGGREDSLYKFKSAFNKNSNTRFAVGKKIFDEEKYQQLVIMRLTEAELDSGSGFFPVYRAPFLK
ncbi:MAG: GNAT family N-acetyltransferase, partial [Clostridiales bacterium]|nr:GNAT family N-acetyltransferase [Clostridiales bacterium]